MASTTGGNATDTPPSQPIEVVHEILEPGSTPHKLDEGANNQPPALPPRPPPRPRQTQQGLDTVEEYNSETETPPTPSRVLRRSCWLKKYVFLCTLCGGLASVLGILFLTVYFMLRSYTTSLNYFETVPTYIPASMMIVTGLTVMCLAGRKNRFSYLIKICGGCCLVCAILCVVVTITTTVIHMSRLQTLRQCFYTQKTQTCTCSSVLIDSVSVEDGNEGIHYVFNATPDCSVVQGALYSCLRAMFGLSVIGILVCLFSCMLVYQLLSHEKKKMYWEQLEMRCRYLYRQQRNPHHCSCCDECRYPEPFPWELVEDRYWSPGRVGNLYSPNPGEEGTSRRAPSGWSWRRLPWSRGAPPPPAADTNATNNMHTGRHCSSRVNQIQRNVANSPDSQYGFSSHPPIPENNPTAERNSNTGSTNSRESRAAQRSRPSRPFMTEGSGGYGQQQQQQQQQPQQQFFLWGPPPPYSNPNSQCNSPARQPITNILSQQRGKRENNASRIRHLHHHHHHHHCQQNTPNEFQHRETRNFDEFSSSGEAVIGTSDTDKNVDNYVNTSEAEMVASSNVNSEAATTDSSESKDGVENTLLTRKMKKRADTYSPEHQTRGQKSSLVHIINKDKGCAMQHGSNQNYFNNQSCNMNEHCHVGEHDDTTENGRQFTVSVPSGRTRNHECGVNEGALPQMRYMSHLQDQELGNHLLCTKNEPTESEVYFADVSSCCNVSVRNDGPDSSLYDEAVDDPRKHRLIMPNQADRTSSETFPMLVKSHNHQHRRQPDMCHALHSGPGHHQFQRIPIQENILSEKGQHHHHNIMQDKNILPNFVNVNNANQDVSNNSFNYQNSSSRIPFPVQYHQHATEQDLIRCGNNAENIDLKTIELDVENDMMGRSESNQQSGREIHDCAFASPMSISSASPGSYPKEDIENCGSYYDNDHSIEMTNCSNQSSAVCSPLSNQEFGEAPHNYQQMQVTFDQPCANQFHHHQHQRKFQNEPCDMRSEFEMYHSGDQHFLAPDAQYETISQQSSPPSRSYQRHSHIHGFTQNPQEDVNGNTPTNSPMKNNHVNACNAPHCGAVISPDRRRLHLPLQMSSSNMVNNGKNSSNIVESLYHTATSTEEEESESQQPQSNCYSDVTLDSGCHSGSEFATRHRGGSIRASSRSARNVGTHTDPPEESDEISINTIRSVNV